MEVPAGVAGRVGWWMRTPAVMVRRMRSRELRFAAKEEEDEEEGSWW